MHCKQHSFEKLPFTPLFKDYTAHFKKIAAFYETDPFDIEAIQERADHFSFSGQRTETVNFLLDFNRQLGADDAAIANIKKLQADDALTLVTGQQLGIFGGPLYTFFKTITVIALARQLQQQLERPVIPIFWMADEDHDYEEVQSVHLPNGNGTKQFSLGDDHSSWPVADIEFPYQVDELKNQIKKNLIDTDFSDDLWALLDDCFAPNQTFLKGFGTLISTLFSKHGLVLAGSNNKRVKALTKDILIQSVEQPDAVSDAISTQTEKLQDLYHQQVTINNSHLFYISNKNERTKIVRQDEQWQTAGGRQWSDQELIEAIEDHPEKFSPDVFLRPLVQDVLLPTLGYVGGPGEVAYYGQMKSVYSVFEMRMPIIFPRLSATFVEPPIDRISNELPFELDDYQKRIEDLESEFAKQIEPVDVESMFDEWTKGIEDLRAYHTETINNIDDTLAGTSKKAEAHYINELNKLKGKTYRAIKRNKEIQINRIGRIQGSVFPNRNLQERIIGGIYYMNKFGVDIWDCLLNNLDNELKLDKHQLIYL